MRQNLNHIAEEMTQFVPLLLTTVDNKDGKQQISQSMSPNDHFISRTWNGKGHAIEAITAHHTKRHDKGIKIYIPELNILLFGSLKVLLNQ